MLFLYNGKVYIKPFENKMVEVNITKRGNEYNVKATEKWLELNDKVINNSHSITVEKAYELQNAAKSIKKFDLD